MSVTTKQALVFSGVCSLLSDLFEVGRKNNNLDYWVSDNDIDKAIDTTVRIMARVQETIDVPPIVIRSKFKAEEGE